MGSSSSPPMCLLTYLWLWLPRGPNCASALACRFASAIEGGWKSVVGGSSILASPAFAVDREMVGKDRDGALIGGDGLFRRCCCCAATAERRAACADCCSLLFGEEEKN